MYEFEFLFYGKIHFRSEIDSSAMRYFVENELISSDGTFYGAIPVYLTRDGKELFSRGRLTDQDTIFSCIFQALENQ
jgi:hypothetical protein